MNDTSITENTWVRLHPDCSGDGQRPPQPAEDEMRAEVTAVDKPGGHSVFALYKGGGRFCVAKPPGGGWVWAVTSGSTSLR